MNFAAMNFTHVESALIPNGMYIFTSLVFFILGTAAVFDSRVTPKTG